jgi:hypothetical protein
MKKSALAEQLRVHFLGLGYSPNEMLDCSDDEIIGMVAGLCAWCGETHMETIHLELWPFCGQSRLEIREINGLEHPEILPVRSEIRRKHSVVVALKTISYLLVELYLARTPSLTLRGRLTESPPPIDAEGGCQ